MPWNFRPEVLRSQGDAVSPAGLALSFPVVAQAGATKILAVCSIDPERHAATIHTRIRERRMAAAR